MPTADRSAAAWSASSAAMSRPARRYCVLRRRQGKLDKTAHLLDFFALYEVLGVQRLEFFGQTEAKAQPIKKRDRTDARLTL